VNSVKEYDGNFIVRGGSAQKRIREQYIQAESMANKKIQAEGHGGGVRLGGGVGGSGKIDGTLKNFYRVSGERLDGNRVNDLIQIHRDFVSDIDFGRKGSKEESCSKDGKDGNSLGTGNNFY
jgi:hypothetical protein